MDRKQINFKVPNHLLERVKRQAKIRGETYTNYIVEAIRMRLGADLEQSQENLGDRDERLSRLENKVKALSDIVDYCTYSIEKDDSSITNIVFALENIRDTLEEMGCETQDPLNETIESLQKDLGIIHAWEDDLNGRED